MEEPDLILQQVAAVVSENMGQNAGEDFYNLYKFEDRAGIIEGARGILQGLLGPEMAEKTLEEVRKKK